MSYAIRRLQEVAATPEGFVCDFCTAQPRFIAGPDTHPILVCEQHGEERTDILYVFNRTWRVWEDVR